MSSLQPQDQSPASDAKPIVTEQPGPEIVAEVRVATASAIVTSKDDPYRILVATSAKHPFPVIPGGKVEKNDPAHDGPTPGLSCVTREVVEEVGTPLLNPRYIGVANDPDRDIRIVPASKVSSAVTEPSLPEGIAIDAQVKAHYGCPDYIFVGQVDEAAVKSTEELSGQHFIDIRQLKLGELSAGHDVIVLAYRNMLDSQEQMLPQGALQDFNLERELLALAGDL